jgi:hypothetical protein
MRSALPKCHSALLCGVWTVGCGGVQFLKVQNGISLKKKKIEEKIVQ